MAQYPTEPLKTRDKAKELRYKIYGDFVTAHDKGELIVGGSGATHFALPAGLGNHHFLAGESYGAAIAANKDFSTACMEAVENDGYARDLCSYMRNYWGSAMLDKYLDAQGVIHDGFPHYDFVFSLAVCSNHTRWYRHVSDIIGGVPIFGYDLVYHSHAPGTEKQWRVDYMVEQFLEAIEWMEKVTGRTYQDELFIEAFRHEARSSKYYGEAMECQKSIPAPLDERMIFVYQGLTSMRPYGKEVADFMLEFRDEVRDRVARGIAAVPNERYRVMTDSNPPWQGLQLYKHIEQTYGVVPLLSIYSLGLHTAMDVDEYGNLFPTPVPHEVGVPMRTREEAVRAYVEWRSKICGGLFGLLHLHSDGQVAVKILQQWKADAMMMHMNRGCWGWMLQKPARLEIQEAGFPVCIYEGSMGDYREFDMERTLERLDSFYDSAVGKIA